MAQCWRSHGIKATVIKADNTSGNLTKLSTDMIKETEQTHWHALVVRPRTERKAARLLAEQGFETCVPVQRQLRQWSDRRKWVESVLFNNYVFVASPARRRLEVFHTGLALKYVSFSGQVAILSAQEVELIKRLDGAEMSVQVHDIPLMRPGEVVEILRGRLAGYHGVVVGMSGKLRVRLRLASLGCFAEVEVNGGDITF